MTDYTRKAIGRRLGIDHRRIVLWRVTAGSGARVMERFGGGRDVARGLLEAQIEVTLLAENTDPERLAEALLKPSSLHCSSARPRQQAGAQRIDVEIQMLYGKDTQHVFKAMLQDFTVRHNQKGRK